MTTNKVDLPSGATEDILAVIMPHLVAAALHRDYPGIAYLEETVWKRHLSLTMTLNTFREACLRLAYGLQPLARMEADEEDDNDWGINDHDEEDEDANMDWEPEGALLSCTEHLRSELQHLHVHHDVSLETLIDCLESEAMSIRDWLYNADPVDGNCYFEECDPELDDCEWKPPCDAGGDSSQ